MITGIVVALPEELSTLTKKIEKGLIGYIDENILVVCSGVGAENATASAEMLVKQGVNSLISWGCAAALDGSFKPGDLVLADSYIDAGQLSIDLNNKGWIDHVLSSLTKQFQLKIHIGKLAESRNLVASSNEKLRIAKTTGAVVLDMESAAIARVSQLYQLPFLAVRAIADPVEMDLPKAISHALSEQGEIVLPILLVFLLHHPCEIPELIKLGMHFYAARNTLKLVAKQLKAITVLPQSTHAKQI